MKNLKQKQEGLTFLGLCIILGFIAIVVLFVLRAFPLYNEKFQVNAAINSVASRPDAESLKDSDVIKYFMHNIQVTNIERFTDNNVKDHVEVIKPTKRGGDKLMHVHYEARNILFGDLYLVLVFDRKVPLKGGGTGE